MGRGKCEQGSKVIASLHCHWRGKDASAHTRGVGSLRLLVGWLGACAQRSGGCRARTQVPVSSASLATWVCWCHFASRTPGLSPGSGKGPASPIPVAFPAPSPGAFFLGPGVQTLRKPLLFLLLNCQCSSLLPSWPCCQRPLVPGWPCMRAGASEISLRLLCLLVGKERWSELSCSLQLPHRNPRVYPSLSCPHPLLAQGSILPN